MAWEIERYLAYLFGTSATSTFDVILPGPDHGLQLRTDRSLRIIVKDKDEGSPSTHFPCIMRGMELLCCNGVELGVGKVGCRLFHSCQLEEVNLTWSFSLAHTLSLSLWRARGPRIFCRSVSPLFTS